MIFTKLFYMILPVSLIMATPQIPSGFVNPSPFASVVVVVAVETDLPSKPAP